MIKVMSIKHNEYPIETKAGLRPNRWGIPRVIPLGEALADESPVDYSYMISTR